MEASLAIIVNSLLSKLVEITQAVLSQNVQARLIQMYN